MTNEEKRLLSKLASGNLDGMVGEERVYREYRRIFCGKYIKDGVPVLYRQGESETVFNGKEYEYIPGKREEKHFCTDQQKLAFLQRYGWLTNDKEVLDYSAKYKPEKR